MNWLERFEKAMADNKKNGGRIMRWRIGDGEEKKARQFRRMMKWAAEAEQKPKRKPRKGKKDE